MSVMMWDSAAQAFVEPRDVPSRYDAGVDAWEDTEGYAYHHESDAWEKVYPDEKILYLYNNGDECKNVTNGWTAGLFFIRQDINSMSSVDKLSNCIRMQYDDQNYRYCEAYENKMIDLKRYSKLVVVYDATIYSSVLAICVHFIDSIEAIVGNHGIFFGSGDNLTTGIDKTFVCDISDISALKYIGIYVGQDAWETNTGQGTNVIKFKEIYLE